MKQAFWKSDWFVGLVISLVFLVLWLGGNAVLGSLERDAYDLGVRMSSADPGDKIAVIAIDDRSVQNIGRWPWGRQIHAQMIDKLVAGGAKTIGNTIIYSEPNDDSAMKWIRQLRSELANVALSDEDAQKIAGTLAKAGLDLDTAAILAASIAAGNNSVLGMQFVPGEPIGNPDSELPAYVTRFQIPEANVSDPSGEFVLPIETIAAVPPTPKIGEKSKAVGHLINMLDVDGASVLSRSSSVTTIASTPPSR